MIGYGIEITGLPGLWPEAAVHPSPRAALRWSLGREPLRSPTREGLWSEHESDALIVGWADWGAFRVDPVAGVVDVTLGPISERDAALGFIFSVWPLILPFFGFEPFHGAALRVNGGALVVLGRAEAGKSTTALALRDAGLRYLADDAAAIDADGLLWPGPPLAVPRAIPGGVTGTGVTYDGKDVIAIENLDQSPVPVVAVAVLRPRAGGILTVSELPPAAAVAELLSQVRGAWALRGLRRAHQLRAAADLAQARVAQVTFDHGAHSPALVAAEIASWVDQAGEMDPLGDEVASTTTAMRPSPGSYR